jgi:two-component system response regulator GlrR
MGGVVMFEIKAIQNPEKFAFAPEGGFGGIIGSSELIQVQIAKARRYAGSEGAVLITGETGTGKEVFARAIHDHGQRRMHSFVAVNCAAVPVELVENELFGHKAGAFTGAKGSHLGVIPEAESGTLFLDEIDSLPMFAQSKLLRFLQEGEYRPLGGTQNCRANVRVIGASNKHLPSLAHNGHFREDLYFRLRVLALQLPPLRSRPEDIPLIANHFIKLQAKELGRRQARFSVSAMQRFMAHDWPGNVRELKNVIQQALVLSDGPLIAPEDLDLPVALACDLPFKDQKALAIEQFERDYLRSMLALHEGNICRAAKAAGEHRRSFRRLLQKHKLLALKFTQRDPASQQPTRAAEAA